MSSPETPPASPPPQPPPLGTVRALLAASVAMLLAPAAWIAVREERAFAAVVALVIVALPYVGLLLALRGRHLAGALGGARILAVAAVVFVILGLGIPSLL